MSAPTLAGQNHHFFNIGGFQDLPRGKWCSGLQSLWWDEIFGAAASSFVASSEKLKSFFIGYPLKTENSFLRRSGYRRRNDIIFTLNDVC